MVKVMFFMPALIKMPQRIISILLIPIVLICTSGGTIFVEHCGMKSSPSYSLDSEQSCCCSKAMHDKCCKESKKIEDNYLVSSATTIPAIELCAFSLPVLTITSFFNVRLSTHLLAFDHAPPNTYASLSVLYRSLLL
jgi:hypothetical protein